MVQPLNYMIDVANPMTMALQGYQAGFDQRRAMEDAATQRQQFDARLGFDERQLAQQADLEQQRIAIARQNAATSAAQVGMRNAQIQAEMDRMNARNSALANLAEMQREGILTTQDVAEFTTLYPEVSDNIRATYQMLTEEQGDQMALEAAQIYGLLEIGETDYVRELLEERQRAAANSGDRQAADTATSMLRLVEESPDIAAVLARMTAAAGGFEEFVGAGDEAAAELQIKRIMETTNPDTGKLYTREEAIQKVDLERQSLVQVNMSNAPTPPSGFQNVFDDQGNLLRQEEIPGGPAERERLGDEGQQAESERVEEIRLGGTLDLLQLNIEAINEAGPFTPVTGPIAERRRTGLGSFLTGQSAIDFQTRSDAITDQAALDEVMRLKEAGGGVGALTEGEREAIGRAQTALNTAGGAEEYLRAARAFRQTALDIAFGEGNWAYNENTKELRVRPRDQQSNAGLPQGLTREQFMANPSVQRALREVPGARVDAMWERYQERQQ